MVMRRRLRLIEVDTMASIIAIEGVREPKWSVWACYNAAMRLRLSKRVGIDLGTANCLVYVVGEGIVMEEPTVVAVSLTDSKVLAVGKEAEAMLGRTPGNIKASKPMRDGVIADYVVTEAMMKYFLRRVGAYGLMRPEVMICVPAGVTQVERRAVLGAAMEAGA